MKHVILLGDSIFDNGSYVGQFDPDVAKQVKMEVGQANKVTLLATDGNVTDDISRQLRYLPEDASHLFISVGGNDALGQLASLAKPVDNVGEGFHEFSFIKAQFEKEYSNMLSNVISVGIPTAVCTIYDPCFYHRNNQRIGQYMGFGLSNKKMQEISVTALSIFNDIITRQAVTAGIPVIDLRLLFNSDHDYANAIEPSMVGGLKIARMIKKIAIEHNYEDKNTMFYG